MVRGAVVIVTPVSGTNQCAETLRMALGQAMRAPICFHPAVYSFELNAFIGFPCPKKIAGSLFMRPPSKGVGALLVHVTNPQRRLTRFSKPSLGRSNIS